MRQTPLLGIGLASLSMLFFSILYAFYKECDLYLPNTVVVFFQALFSWAMLLPFLLKAGVKKFYTSKFGWISLRTIFGLIGLYCISSALQTESLGNVVVLNNTAPFFVPFIAWIWLKERILHRLWFGLIVGFVGILIVLRPAISHFNAGLILALLSGLATGLLIVATKRIAHEDFLKVLFYYFLIIWVILAPFLFTNWTLPPPKIWLYLILAAISSILAQLSFTAAFRYAPPQEVAPFVYTSVIFSGLIDWIIWEVTPDLFSFIGWVVVCTGGVMVVLMRGRAGMSKA